MSGTTCSCSQANIVPVRPKPVITSSAMSSTPVLSHHARDRKSTRLNSSHRTISYAVFCLKKKKKHSNLSPSTIHGFHTPLDNLIKILYEIISFRMSPVYITDGYMYVYDYNATSYVRAEYE